jgi:hypothetical protein
MWRWGISAGRRYRKAHRAESMAKEKEGKEEKGKEEKLKIAK